MALTKKWYKLDNAAKLFPAIETANDPGNFRLSCLFKEKVNKHYLADALDKALIRFPSFKVRLRRGIFWYYFDYNYESPIIFDENPIVLGKMKRRKNKGYLFCLSYFGKRANLEVFHALSDGTGAMEFFKTICYYYGLNITHEAIGNMNVKTNNDKFSEEEVEDSFAVHYDKKARKYEAEGKAYKIKGKLYKDHWCTVVQVISSVDDIKAISKRYNATVTEYVGAALLFSIFNKCFYKGRFNRNVKLFIPVDARRFFKSKSIRNFILYVRTNCSYKEGLDFLDCINYMKETFLNDLKKERLEQRIKTNVSVEKNILLRIIPLFIKKIAIKIAYKITGTAPNTAAFSNLGIVTTPDEFKDYIERFEFMMGVYNDCPINVGSISFNNKFVLSFTSIIKELDFIWGVVDRFKDDNLSFHIESNIGI